MATTTKPAAAKSTAKSPDKAPAKTTTKTPAKTKDKAETSAPKTGGIHAPVQPSPELGEIVGTDKLPRSEVISKVWEYIKANNLQNPENKREILADDKLKVVFGRDKCTMFEMNKYIAAHLKA